MNLLKWTLVSGFVFFASLAFADGPKDNLPDQVRPIPPPGVSIPPGDRAELEAKAVSLGREIDLTRKALQKDPLRSDWLADVAVLHKAVDWALKHNEFFNVKEVATARELLRIAGLRLTELRKTPARWSQDPGLVVRAYRSKIDDSLQPYGLVIPPDYRAGSGNKHRLDIWCHGRGETLSELNFIHGRLGSAGEFTPPGAIVLHLYGRYCCANKFAGETDLFEAMEHVKRHYSIDANRTVIRGFSMGGAACWQFAVHYPSVWAAAAPGAGFSETPEFLRVFQKEVLKPTDYERKLFHLYDCTDYAVNLFNCPTVAYSGAIDSQKQAADIMASALSAEGLTLTHIIGPNTAHRYHPDAKAEINRRIDSIVGLGRNPAPARVRFTTWTLRYNQSFWVSLEGLERHWERATVNASIKGPSMVEIETKNVTSLRLVFPSGYCPLDSTTLPIVRIDGQALKAPGVESDRSWTASFHRSKGQWRVGMAPASGEFRKTHGLQGPIDDAFMDRFTIVRPTGKPLNEKVGAWTASEMSHAIDHWRKQFRGDAIVKDDAEITPADIASCNLILWGDPSSNRVLSRILDKLPIQWDTSKVHIGSMAFGSDRHAPILIAPNPLNPKRYVVINSGFTFREYDHLNNARQIPKLPDYAVIDLSTPPNFRSPGRVAAAGFFDETWKVPSTPK